MFYGSYLQARDDKVFQEVVENYVEKQDSEDAPELVVLKVDKKDTDYLLTVQNVGRKPASSVKVIFSEKSMPSAFAANLISGAREIPQNTKYTLPLNLFTGVNQLARLPNSESGYKEELNSSLRKFDKGEMVFIPRFYIEYYHEKKLLTSPMYYLVLEKRRGLIALGKDD